MKKGKGLNGVPSKKTQFKKIKCDVQKEYKFLENVFSVLHIPLHLKGDAEDSLIFTSSKDTKSNTEVTERAKSITDLEEKLQKLKSEKSYSLKNKYTKKSLTSKLNKKLKKKQKIGKIAKPITSQSTAEQKVKTEVNKVNVAKPIFNNEGKLVFSKFDFANLGQKEKSKKVDRDPKKVLDELKKQEERVKKLEETESTEKVNEVKDKMAWKNILKKAEGEKIKDDPILLKKSIKKKEQRKKHSKKQWDARITNVEQKLKERQKKRQDNIAKKKKEKKTKVVKTAVKRGRVVI